MAEEGEGGGVAGDLAGSLHYLGGAVLDGFGEFAGSVETVNAAGEGVAGIEVRGGGGANGATGDGAVAGPALHARERLADIVAEAGVQRERAIVESGLDEADSGGVALAGAVHDGLHEAAADSVILGFGIDGDGTDAANRASLIQTIAAENAALAFGDHAVDGGVREHHLHQADGMVGVGKIAREVVGGIDAGECSVADLTGGDGIGRRGLSDENRGWMGCHGDLS